MVRPGWLDLKPLSLHVWEIHASGSYSGEHLVVAALSESRALQLASAAFRVAHTMESSRLIDGMNYQGPERVVAHGWWSE